MQLPLRTTARILLTGCLLLTGAAWAETITVGQVTAEVNVRNSTMLLIPGARVQGWIKGQSLHLSATAKGYLAAQAEIPLPATPTGHYLHEFVLADVKKSLAARDLTDHPVQSAQFEPGQEGFPADQFGVTVLIPRKSWPRPAGGNVEILDSVWEAPLKSSCKIEIEDEFYRVRMTIPRSLLDYTGSQLTVYFDTEKSPVQGSILLWMKRLERLEKIVSPPIGSAMALARFLFGVLPRSQVEATGKVPPTLQQLYQQADKFSALHHD